MGLNTSWRAKLPPMRMTYAEFNALPEYSASRPTGTTIGKMWKRHDGAFDWDFIQKGGVPIWIIGRYEEAEDPKLVKICYYRPIIRAKAIHA